MIWPGRGTGGTAIVETADAEEAVRLVEADPHRARRLASTCLTQAEARGDHAASSTARRALGLAARALGDLDGSVSHLREALSTAEEAGLRTQAAQARMSLSLTLAYRGELAPALREADLARAALTGADAPRSRMQRAMVLQLMDRLDEAHAEYSGALRAFRRLGDLLWEARCLNNRAVLWISRGGLQAAGADFRRAEALFGVLGQDLSVADVRWNLGFLAARQGDVPAALSLYDLTDEYYTRNAVPRAHHLLDRCELLLSARLVAEAREAAAQAVVELSRERRWLQLPEARLSLAHAALLEGDATTARANAEQARRAFGAQRRAGWLALARFAGLRAAWLGGARTPSTLAAARRTARALEDAGWVIPGMEARILAAQLGLELGRVATAERDLRVASVARRSGPVGVRMRAWHAEALLRLAKGERQGAETALRAGLHVLDGHRAGLGATELRVHSSSHGEELAHLGLRLALESSSAKRVFAWAERWKAATLLLAPARAPKDSRLERDLTELRAVVAELDSAALDGADTAVLLRRQAALERSVRHRARRTAGSAGAEVPAAGAAAVREALGEAVLVELVQHDDVLYGVAVRARGVRLHALGSASEVRRETEALHFALRRLARSDTSPERAEAAAGAAAFAADRLDALLLAPMAPDIGDSPLVMVPTGPLHALPWGLLATCAGRPVSVNPSAAAWHRAHHRLREPGDSVVLVAGPGLPGAAAEVTRLRRLYPGATAFSPKRCRVRDVLAALDGAGMAHIAAHGTFRADNPLFSSLALGDGPLMVYDLERLGRAPRHIVLSACDSGVSGIRPGDELMGLAATLLALGTATLVASVVPVSDEATHPLMLEFHRALQTGAGPAEALARTGAVRGRDGPQAFGAAASFVCFGAGW